MNRFAFLLVLFCMTSCGGGGSGSSKSNDTGLDAQTIGPSLIANSYEFTAGPVDDDPANPVAERYVGGETAILPSVKSSIRIAASSSIVALKSAVSLAPLPRSQVSISVSKFNAENWKYDPITKKDVSLPPVAGIHGFARANCTEYAAERRDQLAVYFRSLNLSVRPPLKNTEVHNYAKVTTGHAKHWLAAYREAGYRTGGVPAPGAFAVYGEDTTPGKLNPFGHVAVVEKVWYDAGTKKIVGWYVSERNNSSDGQLKRTCFGACPEEPIYLGFASRQKKDLNPANLLGFVYLQDKDENAFVVDSVPLTPANLRAVRTGINRVNLNWQPSGNTQGVSEYVVYRNGTEIDRPIGTSFVDKNVPAIGTVCYEVSTKLLGSLTDSAGLSARTPLICAQGAASIPPLVSPVLSGSCLSGEATLTWSNSSIGDSIVVSRNGEPIKILSAAGMTFSAPAPAVSRFIVRLRRDTDAVESNVVELSCATASPQVAAIAAAAHGLVEFGEQLVESQSRLPWVATYLQSGLDLIVRGRRLEDNSILWQQTLLSTGFASAIVDKNGLSLLTYGFVGDVFLQTNSVNADSTIAQVSTLKTQIAGASNAYLIDTSLPKNQLAQPWKMVRSSSRSLLAIYSGTGVAGDGTAPIWIIDVSAGAPRLVKTIRISGTYVMGLAFSDSDLFVLGGDGVARRFPAESSAVIKSTIALQNPASDPGSFVCSGELCLARANSTGVLEVVDFAAGNTRFVSVGAAFIGRFKLVGGLIVATTSDVTGCKIGVYRAYDGALQASQQVLDCMNGATQLAVLGMAIYDEWTDNAAAIAWTSSYLNLAGTRFPPKTSVYRVTGLR